MAGHDIVVGVDLGEPSLATARWVARHAAEPARLLLVHVLCVPRPPMFLQSLYPPIEPALADARRGAELRLREAARALGVDASRALLREGRPEQELLAVARERGAGLLVVGPHGTRGGLGRLIGGTAERLARHAPCTLLLGRGLPDGPPRTVLVAVDESPLADAVLVWGRWCAERFGARVIALHVVPVGLGTQVVPGASPTEFERARRQMEASADAWLRERCAAAGVPGATRLGAYGDPGLEAMSAVRRVEADLLVIGRHGSGHSGGPFLGSVTEFLLRNGSGPVLVVAGPPGGA